MGAAAGAEPHEGALEGAQPTPVARARSLALERRREEREALEVDEVARRPVSVGLVAKVVLATVALVGAVFTFGVSFQASRADVQHELQDLRRELKQQAAEQDGAEGRLKVLEQVAGGLTPAVAALTAQVDKLAGTVDALRTTVTEQNVELRHVKEALQRIGPAGLTPPR